MKKLLILSFCTFVLFLGSCKKDNIFSRVDKENYYIVDGKTIYKTKDVISPTVCGQGSYAWMNDMGITESLVISNTPDMNTCFIDVVYTANGETKKFGISFQNKTFPTKNVGGVTVIEFSNETLINWNNSTETKIFSGKVTCN